MRVAIPLSVALVTAMTHATPAFAKDEVRVRLRYERASSAAACPDEAGMRDAVSARLGYDPFVADASGEVAIGLERRGGEWHGRIALDDAAHGRKGTRALVSSEPSCDELVSSIALAVAVAIDPMRLAPDAPPPEPPTGEPARTGAPAPAAEPPRAEARTEPKAATPAAPGAKAAFFVGAGAFGTVGVVPRVSFGPHLRAGLAFPRWSVAVEGAYVAPASEPSPSGRVVASVFAGGVVPCARFGEGDAVVDACLRALFGGLFGEATGVGSSSPSTDPYVAVGAELGAELALGSRLGLRLHAGALATLSRTFLRIRDAGRDVDVWSTPPFGGSAGLDAVVHFP